MLQQPEEAGALGYEVVTGALQDQEEDKSNDDLMWIFGFDMERIGVMNDIIHTVPLFQVSLSARFLHSTVYIE